MNKPKYKVRNANLPEIVKDCYSYRQVLKKLGLKEAGGNYKTLKKAIEDFNVDISHFKKQGWLKGLKNIYVKRRDLKELLVDGSYVQTYKLKNRLLDNSLLIEKCYICNCEPMWFGKKLILVLDHINGKNDDNRLENLRLLCPNCNSQQDTFCGRNKKNKNKLIQY